MTTDQRRRKLLAEKDERITELEQRLANLDTLIEQLAENDPEDTDDLQTSGVIKMLETIRDGDQVVLL